MIGLQFKKEEEEEEEKEENGKKNQKPKNTIWRTRESQSLRALLARPVWRETLDLFSVVASREASAS